MPWRLSCLSYGHINASATVAAAGGENIETLDKIKYTAPRAYAAQNRAVTSNTMMPGLTSILQ